MKKYFSFLLLLGAVFLMSSCELGLGDTGEDAPENIFSGNEWEWKYNNDGGAGNIYHLKISFFENTFSLYHRQDRIHKEDTITGTYSLFYEEINEPPVKPYFYERIKFTSDEPTLNGTARYTFYNFGHPDNSVSFFDFAGDLTYLGFRVFTPAIN